MGQMHPATYEVDVIDEEESLVAIYPDPILEEEKMVQDLLNEVDEGEMLSHLLFKRSPHGRTWTDGT